MISFLLKLFILINVLHNLVLAKQINEKNVVNIFYSNSINNYGKSVLLKGNVHGFFLNQHLFTNKLLYDIEYGDLLINDNFIIQDTKDNIVCGKNLLFNTKLLTGTATDCLVKLQNNIVFLSKVVEKFDNNIILYDSCFTPCTICNKIPPIWQLTSKKSVISIKDNKAIHYNTFFELYGIPIFYVPYFFHPLSTEARSGFLIPEITHKKLSIPIYIRLRSNLDFTFTPKISKYYSVYEMEIRHALNNKNYYNIIGSYNNKIYGFLKNTKNINARNSYYLTSIGNFINKHYNYKYGFDINISSDKAYLKNNYNIYNQYLNSKFYFNKVTKYDYFLLEALYYQDFYKFVNHTNNSFLCPRIKFKKSWYLNHKNNLSVSLLNHFNSHYNKNLSNLNHYVLQMSLDYHNIDNLGYFIDMNFISKNDIYFSSKFNSNNLYLNQQKLNVILRYPIIKPYLQKRLMIFEPFLSGIYSNKLKKYNSKVCKFLDLLDSDDCSNLILSSLKTNSENIGNNIDCGINCSFFLNRDNLLQINLTKNLFNKYNYSNYHNYYKGKISINMENLSLFYKFNKSYNTMCITNEIGSNFVNKNLELAFSNTILSKNRDSYHGNFVYENQKKTINQSNLVMNYSLTKNIKISSNVRFNVLSKQKPSVLYKSFSVLYSYDCIKFFFKAFSDSTSNIAKGIKKNKGYDFSFGLQILSM